MNRTIGEHRLDCAFFSSGGRACDCYDESATPQQQYHQARAEHLERLLIEAIEKMNQVRFADQAEQNHWEDWIGSVEFSLENGGPKP